MRDSLAFGKDGAQALVPRHHIAQRRLQGRYIQFAFEPQRHRDGVGGAPPTFLLFLQPMQEPQPPLCIGERDVMGTRKRLEPRPCRLGRIQTFGQPRNRGGLEQAADR